MKTIVEFRSDRFPAYDGEDKQINPGIFGKRLAELISDGLRREGFEPEELFTEDRGWVVPVKNKGFPPLDWLRELPGVFGRVRGFLKKIATRDWVESLQTALDKILSDEAGIREKKWWTHEEFDQPKA